MVVEMRLIFVLLVFAFFGCACAGEQSSNLEKNRYLQSTKEVLQVLGQVYGRLAKLTGTVIKGHCNTKHHEAATSSEINPSYDEGKILDTLVWIYTSLSDLNERLTEIKILAENDRNYLRKPAMTMRGLGEVASRYLEPVEANFEKVAEIPSDGIDNSKLGVVISNKDQLKIAETLLKDIEVASSMLNKNNRLLIDKLKHFSEENLYTVIVEDNDAPDIHEVEKNSANQGLLTKAGVRALKHAFSFQPDSSEETELFESDEELLKARMENASPDGSFYNSGDYYKPSNKLGAVNPFLISNSETKHEFLESFDHLYDPKSSVKPVIPLARSSDIGNRSSGRPAIRTPNNANVISNPGRLFRDRSLISTESDHIPMTKDKPSTALPISQTGYYRIYQGIPLQDSDEKNSDLKKKKVTGIKISSKGEEDHIIYDPKSDVKLPAKTVDSWPRLSGRRIIRTPNNPVSKLFTEESNAISNPGRSSGDRSISKESDYIPMIKDQPFKESPILKPGYYRIH